MPEVSPVRVRFAPSPTGTLHLGGARTAIYNWAFARKHGGDFILRIDDTDSERSTPENVQQILDALTWLGLDWDEGPKLDGSIAGDAGPYFQTQRGDSYQPALEKMIANNTAYRCFCTMEELAAKRDAARLAGGSSGYDRTCRHLSVEEAQTKVDADTPFVWRLKVPEGRTSIVVNDLVRGETAFPIEAVDDLVLMRSDGTPTYNFASTVDDADMGITHIIRGDDHLSNTPKQILIFEALAADDDKSAVPAFAHLSMIYGDDGKKLSKRHGAVGVEEFAAMGFLPDALLNGLALLGWSLDAETTIVTPKMLKEKFSLDRVSKNPARFDMAKLEHINSIYIQEMSTEEFVQAMLPWLEAEGLSDAEDVAARPEWYTELAPLISERIKLMTEVVPMTKFLFVDEVEIDKKARAKALDKDSETTAIALKATYSALEGLDTFDLPNVEAVVKTLPAELDLKPRVVFQAIRVALSGSLVSPPLFESIVLLGKERSLERLSVASKH
ncbi:MAG: glutamate--tRNA ligase [Coriobacteriia bacterium]|nr:glutamate--tRNA ligase [Coriobacteriia bacterium]